MVKAENLERPQSLRAVPAAEDIVMVVPPTHMAEALELAASSQRVRGVLVLPGGCRSAHISLNHRTQTFIVAAQRPHVKPSRTRLTAFA